MKLSDYCTITEAAQILGVTRQRVFAMIKAGILKAEKIGNQWAIERESVNRRLNR
jgi:excisionase family DNA binding protein